MDKTQAMRKFVKENILKLTSAECDKEVEKQLRRNILQYKMKYDSIYLD